MRASLAHEAGETRPFADESRELLRLLQEAGFAIVRRSYDPGEAMGGGEGRAALYVLTSGTGLLVREDSAGREVTLSVLKEWDVFGALWFAEGALRGVRARAATSCEVATLPRPLLVGALGRYPEVALKLLTLQDAQLTRYEEFVLRISSRSILVRLAGLLLTFCEGFPEERPALSRGVTIGLRFTHRELAAMLVASREAVCMAMGQLRTQGVLEARNGAITVTDAEKLREISAGRAGQAPGVRAAPVGRPAPQPPGDRGDGRPRGPHPSRCTARIPRP